MARQCVICSKKTISGRQISHAHNVSPRTWKPNLQRLRIVLDGTVRRALVCTRCVRSGRVEKAPVRDWQAEEAAEQPTG